MLGGIRLKKNYTDHEKNLDYFQDNYPELLDDYIFFYENGALICDETINPEEMLEVVRITAELRKEHNIKLN